MAERRRRMVERDLRARGVGDPRVLEAFGLVPREMFLPDDLADVAYEDCALPIAEGQTVSQPYVVAVMIEASGVGAGARVLEVGTGSGYGAAVLSRVAGEVWTLERYGSLASAAVDRLAALGYGNVNVVTCDGSKGWPEAAPYDAVIVTAAGPAVPPALIAQLRVGGYLVMPIGQAEDYQSLTRLRRVEGTHRAPEVETEVLAPVRFVPLLDGVVL
ncbi:MAG TPA: protein-L-isoaspartate(D-aspartate) O-methyltransferase [Acidimicrobiales bacterium]|nr:protein-L-isoaspartate(D-aspartate) O-methyltransferase [Acidimicrobiales bacterium]